MRIKRSITPRPNTLEMRTTMAFVRCMSTPWKAFGRCCARGYAHIAAFLRNSYRCTWDSLNSYIMFVGAARLYWLPCYLYWLLPDSPIEPFFIVLYGGSLSPQPTAL